MEILSSSYNSRKKIYDGHLQEIRGINFTPREIDIIACILHNRGEKKIASLLSISPRTVGTHVHNIMLKLGCNSREYITDLIEKSGKLQFVKQYYLHLLVLASFEQQLKKIGKTINRSDVVCFVSYGQITDEIRGLIHSLGVHLKLANVILTEKHNGFEQIKYNLCIFSEKLSSLRIKADQILLIVDSAAELPKKSSVQYIDFRNADNYYSSTLLLLKEILGSNDLDKISREFNKECQAIKSSWEGYNNGDLGVANNIRLKLMTKNNTIVFLIISIVLVGIMLIIIKFGTQNNDQTISSALTIHEKLAKYVKDFSDDSANKESVYSNQSIIKQVENIVLPLINDKDQTINIDQLSSDQLSNFLYNIHALSGYYINNGHDGEKAREVLEYGKNLAESYIVSRSKVPINFDKLDKEEIYAELATIKDLPEMYTKIIYLLGRTYIYYGDRKPALRYFEISQYLGNKLNLFEGHLSSRNGLGVMQGDEINIDLENRDYQQAQEKLDQVIKLYKELKYNNTAYMIGYRPNNVLSKIVVPKKDIINEVECSEQIAKYYTKLTLITDDAKKQKKYITEITNQFVGDNDSLGLFKQSKNIWGRRLASIYNTLGNILLNAYDAHIDFTQLKIGVIQQLNLTTENDQDMEIIEQIFEFAKLQSRSTEYTKADSYDGLLKVYKRQIDQMKLKKEQGNDKLSIKIEILRNKRDHINKELNRKCKYDDNIEGKRLESQFQNNAIIKCSF